MPPLLPLVEDVDMVRMVRLVLALSVILLVAGLLAGAGIAAADEPPQLPHAFYGSVQLYSLPNKSDLCPAPVGTVVTAKVDGEVKGQITVTEAGLYGGEGPDDPKLLVQDGICSGCIIEFYVNGELAEEVRVQYVYPGGLFQGVDPEWQVEFNSGTVWGLDLIAYGICGDGDGGGGGGGGGLVPTPTPGPPGPIVPTPTPTPTPQPGPGPTPTPPPGPPAEDGGGIPWWVWLLIGIGGGGGLIWFAWWQRRRRYAGG